MLARIPPGDSRPISQCHAFTTPQPPGDGAAPSWPCWPRRCSRPAPPAAARRAGVGRRRPGPEGGHGGGDRLAQPVRRDRRPGVQRLRHGVPAARAVRAGRQDRGRLRGELDALRGRAGLDVPPAPRRQVVGRQAADRRGRRMDGNTVLKYASGPTALLASSLDGVKDFKATDDNTRGRHVQAAGRAGARQPRAVLHPARAHLVEVHRQQRQGSEGVLPGEAPAGGRRRGVLGDQVRVEGRDRASSRTPASTARSPTRPPSRCPSTRTRRR